MRPEIVDEMAIELQADLEQAAAAGVPAASYVAGNPWTQDFSVLPWVAITDAVVATAGFAISVALVRSFAVRKERL